MRRPSFVTGPILLAAALALPAWARAAESPGDVGRHAEAYRLYSLAQQSLLSRDYSGALEFLEQAAAHDDAPGLLLELARLRFTLNDLDRAEALAQRVAAADPAQAQAHDLLGDIYLSRAREGGDAEADVARAVDQYRAALSADPSDDDACRSLAELYYHTGRIKECADLLASFAGGATLTPAMSLLLGKADLRLGRAEEAERILTGVVARSPGNLEAVDALGSLYEYQKKYDEAIGLYGALLQSGPPTAYLRDRIGSLHLEAGHFKDAIRELEAAQALDPGDSRGLLTLAQAYEGAADTAAALSAYDRLIQREQGNLEARFYKARLQQKEGDSDSALQGFRSIIDLATGRGAVTDREAAVLALAYSQVGIIEMEARNYEEAASAFVRALDNSEDPGPELFLLLGRVDLERGKPEDAEQVAREAQRRYPEDLDLSVLQGEVLIVRGDFPKASDFYQALLKSSHGSPEAYARISEALLRQKRFEEAETILREGTRLHPADDTLFFARGAALERLGKVSEAEHFLSKAIRLNPKNAAALNYLGYMLADRGLKLRDSIAYVERALALDPKNAAYLDSLGWAQFKMNLYGPAEQSLRSAVRYEKSDPTIREHLGDLLMATGRAEEAVREWESALAHGHDEPARIKEKIEHARASLKVER